MLDVPRIHVLPVAPMMIAQVWPLVVDMIDAGYAAADELMPPNLREWLSEGRGILWIAERSGRIIAAMTSSLVQKRSGLVCRLVCCSGSEMPSWLQNLDQIEEYAKAEGCVKVIADGRPGWQHVLSGRGYAAVGVSLEKRLP